MPIDESGNLFDQTPNSVLSVDIDSHAPPLYGEHVLDQLYADMDTSGFTTPTPQSGASTPFYSHSRSGSVENISSMGDIVGYPIGPDALSNRLRNLNANLAQSSRSTGGVSRRFNGTSSGGDSPSELHHGHPSTSSMPSSVAAQPSSCNNPLSRHPSDENSTAVSSGLASGRQSPEHIDFSDMHLNRVPSYSTAVKTPVRNMSYSELQALPNYDTAVSAPPSPQRGNSVLATVTEVTCNHN